MYTCNNNNITYNHNNCKWELGTVVDEWILTCFLYRPYVIDLESTNGTYVNNQRIEPARYYELKEKVRKTLTIIIYQNTR